MGTMNETLSERVQELLTQAREPILSTTGTRAALEALEARTQALERAVAELAEALEGLSQTKALAGRSETSTG